MWPYQQPEPPRLGLGFTLAIMFIGGVFCTAVAIVAAREIIGIVKWIAS